MESTITIEKLKPEISFKSDLMLDNQFVLLPGAVPVTDELIKALNEWGFKEFQSNDDMSLGGTIGVEKFKDSSASQNKSQSEITQKINNSVKQALEDAKAKKFENSEKERLSSVKKVYNEYMNYINSVYTGYATKKKIDYQELSDTVKDLCIFIRENKRYVLRIQPSAEARKKNFLVIHSMRTTVLSITIGLEIHMPLSKLIELGITSILHEIGMLRLPPQLYMTDKTLSPGEKAQIMQHPIFGFNILKELEFPLSIQLGVIEHHEKENGLGYPRHLTGSKISNYAKIIAVSCSYEAITAPREYKSEKTSFEAMLELLQNKFKAYDGTIIKALLYSLSLYPIGAYVYLNNGKIAIVSDVSTNNPKNPIVQLLNEKESDGSPKTLQTDDGANKIIRVLSQAEQADVEKSLQMQKDTEAEHKKQINESLDVTNQFLNAAKAEKEIDSQFSVVDLSEFS